MCVGIKSLFYFGLAFPFPEISFSSLDKELFAAYAFYAGIVTLKMLIMSPLTARQRFKTNTFISSEDAVRPGTKVKNFRQLEHFTVIQNFVCQEGNF